MSRYLTPNVKRERLIALLGLGAAVAIGAIVSSGSALLVRLGDLAPWLAFTSTVSLAVLVAWYRFGRDIFAPQVLLPVLYFYIYGVGWLVDLTSGRDLYPVVFVVLSGWVSLFVGLHLGARVPRRAIESIPPGVQEREWNYPLMAPLALGLILLNLGATLLFIARSGGPAFLMNAFGSARMSNALTAGVIVVFGMRLVIPLSILFCAFWLPRHARPGQVPLRAWLVLACGAVVMTFSGWRWDLITLVLMVSVMLYYQKRLRKGHIAVAIVMAVAFYFGFGFFRAMGSGDAYSEWLLRSFDSPLERLWYYVVNEPSVSYGALKDVMRVFPSTYPFLLGRSLAISIGALAPGHQDLFDTLLKELLGRTFAGGLNPSICGELYLNWGVPGVVIGMTGLGWITARYHARVRACSDEPRSLSTYAILLGTVLLVFRMGSAAFAVGFLTYTVVRLIWLLAGRQRRPGLGESLLYAGVLIILIAQMLWPGVFIPWE